jgi:pilus assembly protein CpaB
MNRIKWIVAVGLGVLAAAGHQLYAWGLRNEASGGEKIEVLSYAEDVEVGEKVVDETLAKRMVPVSYVDERAVRAEKVGEILGMEAAIDVKAGQIAQWSDFVARTESAAMDLSDFLESGQRAITIPVDRSLSMGGNLRPGHRVDVLGTFRKGEDRHNRVTVTLLQNVKVLAVGRSMQSNSFFVSLSSAASQKAARSRTVTLSVGLDEAALLSLSTKQGSLSLALRGRQDLEVIKGMPEVGMADIWEPERRSSFQKKTSIQSAAIERIQVR